MSFNYDNPGKIVISPVKLAHVVLRTNNLEKMVDFYVKFLGGRIQFQNEQLAFITYDDEHHRLALANIPQLEPKNPMTNGLEHIAFTFGSLPEHMMAYRQRLQHGIKPLWCVNHAVTLSMYYTDPDGNKLEAQIDLMDMSEEANAFMRSEVFKLNQVGINFDPEDIVEQLKNGVPEKEILKYVPIGKRDLETVPHFMPVKVV